MEEIETLYSPEGSDHPRACWFPFKKAYTRRQISEAEEHTRAVVLSKTLWTPLQEHARPQLGPVSASPLEFDGRLRRSFLSELETNSIISEGDHAMEYRRTLSQNPAGVDAYPARKQLWPEAILGDGSLAPDPQGSNASPCKSIRDVTQSLQDISLSRIGLNSNISQPKKRNPSSSMKGPGNTGKDDGWGGCCNMRSDATASTDNSTASAWMGSDTDGASSTDSMPGRVGSLDSKAKTARGNALNVVGCASTKASHPEPLRDSIHRRARSTPNERSLKPVNASMGVDSDKRIPAAINVCSTPQRSFARDRSLGNTTVNTHSVDSTTMNSSQHTRLTNISGDAGCISAAALGFLLLAQSAKECVPSDGSARDTRLSCVDDPRQPHFFVEVEATRKQLRDIKDLDIVKAQEERFLLRPVEMARQSSLADDDSAFMDKQCIPDVLNRFSHKRQSPTRAQSVPRLLNTNFQGLPVASPGRTSVRPQASPAKSNPCRNAPRVRPDRQATSTPSNANPSIPPAKTQRSEPPIPRTISPNFDDEDLILGPGGSRLSSKTFNQGISRNASKAAQKIPNPKKKPSLATVGEGALTTCEQSMASNGVESSGVHVVKIQSRPLHDPSCGRSQAPKVDNKVAHDPLHDFEVARFPSLSSEDWRRTKLQDIGGVQDRNFTPSFSTDFYDQDVGQYLDPDYDYLQVDPVKENDSGFNFPADWKNDGWDRVPSFNDNREGGSNFDDDGDSLNTETFRRIGTNGDDDSIFTGLADLPGQDDNRALPSVSRR